MQLSPGYQRDIVVKRYMGFPEYESMANWIKEHVSNKFTMKTSGLDQRVAMRNMA